MVNPNSRILANDMIRDRTISKVQRQTDRSASHWNWMSYLNGIFERTDVIVDYNKDVVGLTDTSYFKELPKVLARSSRGTIGKIYCVPAKVLITRSVCRYLRRCSRHHG